MFKIYTYKMKYVYKIHLKRKIFKIRIYIHIYLYIFLCVDIEKQIIHYTHILRKFDIFTISLINFLSYKVVSILQ